MSISATQLQKDWENRISRARAVREEWAKEFRVEAARKFFRGAQNPGWPADEWITINKIYSHLRDQLPVLYSVDPFFYVKLKRSFSVNPFDVAMFEQRGKIRQSYLNYLKGEVKLKAKIRLAVLDAQFEYGVLKTRYAADESQNPDAGNSILAEDGETALLGDDGAPLIEPDTVPINERYQVNRVHPKDFLWDEDAGPLDDKWAWVAERILLTDEDVEKDPLIKKAIVREAPPASEEDIQGETSQRGLNRLFARGEQKTRRRRGGKSRPDDDKRIWVAWEIYDLKHKQWLKIVEGASALIIDPREVPNGIEGHPYGILRFMLLDDTAYPLPPISQAIDPQKEYCLARSQLLRHRKRFNRKYEVVTPALEDESELTKLETGDDGTIIRVKQLGTINPIKDAPLDQGNYTEILALSNDMVEILGSPAAEGLQRADSATQASLLDKRLDIREGDDVSSVIDFTIDVGAKLDQLVQANISRDEAVRIVGPQGEQWEMVRVEDFQAINGEFEYSVNVGATLPRLPQIERAQFLALLQVLASFPHLMTSPALMKHLSELHRIDNDQMVQELMRIGQQIISGQVAGPGGGGGSKSGVSENNPIAAILGQALGAGGGVSGGGGASGATQ
jgi:uncharacterized membrane protein YgcG